MKQKECQLTSTKGNRRKHQFDMNRIHRHRMCHTQNANLSEIKMRHIAQQQKQHSWPIAHQKQIRDVCVECR